MGWRQRPILPTGVRHRQLSECCRGKDVCWLGYAGPWHGNVYHQGATGCGRFGNRPKIGRGQTRRFYAAESSRIWRVPVIGIGTAGDSGCYDTVEAEARRSGDCGYWCPRMGNPGRLRGWPARLHFGTSLLLCLSISISLIIHGPKKYSIGDFRPMLIGKLTTCRLFGQVTTNAFSVTNPTASPNLKFNEHIGLTPTEEEMPYWLNLEPPRSALFCQFPEGWVGLAITSKRGCRPQ
jgi:hypothetical protein